jgi:23S rRNA (guanosine2251-2'-O)-methyltransferase
MEKIYGKHSVRAAFMQRPRAIKRLILLAGKLEPPQEFIELAQQHDVPVEILPWLEFLKAGELTQDEKHQGVCIYAEPLPIYSERDLKDLKDARVVFALDQITNPQNLATIIRGAAFFGVDAILLMKNRAAQISPVVTRVAVGGAEFVPIYNITNLARSLDTLKKFGFWVYGLDERGKTTLAQTEFSEKTVFVVGAEGEGLRQRTGKFCDYLVRIPGGRKGVESLNASVAATLAMAEFYR